MKDRPDNGKITRQENAQSGPSREELEKIKSHYAEADAIISGGDSIPQGADRDQAKEDTAGGCTAREEDDGSPSSHVQPPGCPVDDALSDRG